MDKKGKGKGRKKIKGKSHELREIKNEKKKKYVLLFPFASLSSAPPSAEP